MSINILLVEDDSTIADFVEIILNKEGYNVFKADTAMNGINAFQNNEINLVLLDLGLPDVDGMELLKVLRKQYSIPIMIISARDNELGKVQALDLGADDYITKPFGTEELLARIRTALRHSNINQEDDKNIVNKDLVIDYNKHLVQKNGRNIHLTKNEFILLKVLTDNIGKVVTYNQLATAIYGPYIGGDTQVLRVNMSNIRKKLEDDPVEPQYIITEIGIGYRMKDFR